MASAELHVEPRLQYLIHASIQDDPREDVTYPIITELLLQHKHPDGRFTIYPQTSLRWRPENPKDRREEVPDIGVGHFTGGSHFRMRFGIESKRMVDEMRGLPEPWAPSLQDGGVQDVFYNLFLQGEDQAKAAIIGGHTLSLGTLHYLLFVGPYFTSVKYGPFTQGQLQVCTLKRSDSDDYLESVKAMKRLSSSPTAHKLYLLGTRESATEIERILSLTDELAEPFIQEANNFQ